MGGTGASGADLERGSPTTAAGDSGKSGATFAPGNGIERVLCSMPCATRRRAGSGCASDDTTLCGVPPVFKNDSPWNVEIAAEGRMSEGHVCSQVTGDRQSPPEARKARIFKCWGN